MVPHRTKSGLLGRRGAACRQAEEGGGDCGKPFNYQGKKLTIYDGTPTLAAEDKRWVIILETVCTPLGVSLYTRISVDRWQLNSGDQNKQRNDFYLDPSPFGKILLTASALCGVVPMDIRPPGRLASLWPRAVRRRKRGSVRCSGDAFIAPTTSQTNGQNRGERVGQRVCRRGWKNRSFCCNICIR